MANTWHANGEQFGWKATCTRARSLREQNVHTSHDQNAVVQINACDWNSRTEHFLFLQAMLSRSLLYNSWWHSEQKSETAGSGNFKVKHCFLYHDLSYFKGTCFKEWRNTWNSSPVNHSLQKCIRDYESLNLAIPEVHCCIMHPPTSFIHLVLSKTKTSF